MNYFALVQLLAFAQAAQPGQPQPPIWVNLVPMALIMVVFYFVLIHPQRKQAKAAEKLRSSIKAGDKIVTTSGIYGTIVGVKERFITLRSGESKFEILKSSVHEVVERGGSEN